MSENGEKIIPVDWRDLSYAIAHEKDLSRLYFILKEVVLSVYNRTDLVVEDAWTQPEYPRETHEQLAAQYEQWAGMLGEVADAIDAHDTSKRSISTKYYYMLSDHLTNEYLAWQEAQPGFTPEPEPSFDDLPAPSDADQPI